MEETDVPPAGAGVLTAVERTAWDAGAVWTEWMVPAAAETGHCHGRSTEAVCSESGIPLASQGGNALFHHRSLSYQ
jgi:hypothetical protein